MKFNATYDVSSSPDDVAAHLANPRNLVLANHEGPVVDQSDPPIRAGSWFVLAFDQLRLRVEYTTFDPPTLIALSTIYSGRGSAGMQGTYVYQLASIPKSPGTRITLDADVSGGWLPDVLARLLLRRSLKRLQSRMDAAIHGA
jgi:hypothetical protein